MNTKFKSIFALALLLTLPVGLQPADTAPGQSAEEAETIKLVSYDEQSIMVPKERAILSATVKNVLDDFSEEELAAGIPLGSECCTHAMLKTLFCDGGYVEKFRNNELADLPGELHQLIPILHAVNFLDIVIGEQPNQRKLLDKIFAKIATVLAPEMLEDEENLAALETTLNEIPNELQAEIAAQLLARQEGQCALGSALYKTVQHESKVNCVAFSLNGKYIATASWDKTARVYDLKSPDQPTLTVQHQDCVNCVAFSLDGTYIATASSDHTARVYDLKSLDQPTLTVQHQDWVASVAFSHDDKHIATASWDKTTRVYDLESTAEPILTVQHQSLVNSVAFSHNGKYIATASDDNTARVYDLKSPAEPILTVQHSNLVCSVAFSHDGKHIATASWDETARVYDLKSPAKPIITVQHGDGVNSVTFSHDGTYIATTSDDNTARVYDLKSLGQLVLTVEHGSRVRSVAFSHDGTYIATASNDKTALVYDLKRPDKPILTLQHGDSVKSVAFAPDGTYIATASSDRTAQIHLLPPNSAFRYLTIRQALFILLAQQKSDAHQTIVPSEQIQQIWSLFNPEAKHFLMVKFGRSSLRSMLARITAATRIQAIARGYICRRNPQAQKQELYRLSFILSPLRLLAFLGKTAEGDVDNSLEVMDNGFENIGLDTLEEYDN